MLEVQRWRGDEWKTWHAVNPRIHIEPQYDSLYSICSFVPDCTPILRPLLPVIRIDDVRVFDYRIDGRGSYLEKDADRCRPDDPVEERLWRMGFVKWERRLILEAAADSKMNELDLGEYVKGNKPNHLRVRRIIGLV